MTKIFKENPWSLKHCILGKYYDDSPIVCLDLTDICNITYIFEKEDYFEVQLKEKNIGVFSDEELKEIDTRLTVLEDWELKRRSDLEILAKKVQELEELEDEIDNLEDLIESSNMEIDEDDFLAFCERQIEDEPSVDTADSLKELSLSVDTADSLKELSLQTPKTPQKQNRKFNISATSTSLKELSPQTPKTPQKQNTRFKISATSTSLKELSPQTPKTPQKQNRRFKISATSTPIKRKRKKTEIIDKFVTNDDGIVVIGPNGTMIAKNALQSINWSLSGAALTRKILMEVFDRETLAFHTLTGKPSPAFMDCDKPMKDQLDPLKVADIIHMVMEHTELTAKEVRNAITTKCADENKMFRQREKKRKNATLKLQRKRKRKLK